MNKQGNITAQPLTTDAITFRDVVETESNEVAGKEVVYTPLEWDPLTPRFSDFNRYPNDGSELSYITMSGHTRCMDHKVHVAIAQHFLVLLPDG